MVQTEDDSVPQFTLKLDDDFPCGAAYRAIRSPRTNSSSGLKQQFQHSDSDTSLEKQDLAKRAQRRVIDHKRSELEKKQELEKVRQKKLEAEKLKKERTSQLRHRRRAEIYALDALMKQLQQDKIAAFIAQQRQRVAASSFEHIVPNCCMVYWLPCVSLAQISARLGVASYNLVLLTLFVLFLIFGVTDFLYTLAVLGAANDDGTNDIIDPITGFADTPLAVPAQLASLVYGMALVGLTAFLRVTTRTRYNIPGNVCFDVLASVCCNCCAMAQVASHVKSYKKGSCGFGPLDTLPAYPHDSQV